MDLAKKTIKKLDDADEYCYFFLIDAKVHEKEIEKNLGLRQLSFFPKNINERDIQKTSIRFLNCLTFNFQLFRMIRFYHKKV